MSLPEISNICAESTIEEEISSLKKFLSETFNKPNRQEQLLEKRLDLLDDILEAKKLPQVRINNPRARRISVED